MSTGIAVSGATTFVWLGMVLAISFLEAPLKFRAPDVTRQIGLGIGRLVFRALNGVEIVLATVIVVTICLGPPRLSAVLMLGIAFAALVFQLVVVRPRLKRRSDRVLAGLNAPRSRAHYVYLGFEVVKVIALTTAGVLLLSG